MNINMQWNAHLNDGGRDTQMSNSSKFTNASSRMGQQSSMANVKNILNMPFPLAQHIKARTRLQTWVQIGRPNSNETILNDQINSPITGVLNVEVRLLSIFPNRIAIPNSYITVENRIVLTKEEFMSR